MYIIEYQEWVFTYCIKQTERFQSSEVLDFFNRVKKLRDLGHSLTTYFID